MQIVLYLLQLVFFVLVGAALMRAWMNFLRVQMSVQPGQFVMAVTDWMVKPMRRILPKPLLNSRLDWGSLLSAFLLCLAYVGVVLMVVGFGPLQASAAAWLLYILIGAGKFLLKVVIQGLTAVLFIYAILSWVQPQSPAMGILHRLTEPLLRPIRKVVPLVGGIDLSVMILMVLLQVLAMALGV